MVSLVFEIAPGEKLEYTWDFTAELNAISATIEGTPTISVSPSSFASNIGSPTVDGTSKLVTILGTIPADAAEQEVAIVVTANCTGSPDRNIKSALILNIKPVPPTATNGYTTPARVIAELGITDPAQQSLVSLQVLEASAMIESYCNRTFYLQEDIAEAVASSGGFILMVEKTPIISISSITFDGGAVASGDYSIHDAGAGMIYARSRWQDTGSYGTGIAQEIYPNSEEKLYTVTYDGGYILPGQPGRTLPHDIERACIELVKNIRNMRADASVKSEAVPGVYSVEYFDGSQNSASIPDNIAKMLAPYRRVMI